MEPYIIYLGADMMGRDSLGLFHGTEDEAAEWAMRPTEPHYFFYDGDLDWLEDELRKREEALHEFIAMREAETNAAVLTAIKADYPQAREPRDPSWWQRLVTKIRGGRT